jgi:hypothetical protein
MGKTFKDTKGYAPSKKKEQKKGVKNLKQKRNLKFEDNE